MQWKISDDKDFTVSNLPGNVAVAFKAGSSDWVLDVGHIAGGANRRLVRRRFGQNGELKGPIEHWSGTKIENEKVRQNTGRTLDKTTAGLGGASCGLSSRRGQGRDLASRVAEEVEEEGSVRRRWEFIIVRRDALFCVEREVTTVY